MAFSINKPHIIFAFITTLITTIASAETVTIDGKAFLENQTNHSNIKVVFERVTPSALWDSTYTNNSGAFSIQLETGIYNITYSKESYFVWSLNNQALYSNITLQNVTLVKKTTLINVPDIFPSIQSAINSSSNGDTVLVAPGTYYENINYNGKNITVASHFLITKEASYIAETIIDGNQNGRVVDLLYIEGTPSLCGFTITNGNTTRHKKEGEYLGGMGGGIICYSSNAILSHLIIINNKAERAGGGISIWSSHNLIVENVVIRSNYSTGSEGGGGVYCYGSAPLLKNTTINGNETLGYGSAISSFYSDFIVTIVNCLFCYNIGDNIFYNQDSGFSISYSNFFNNEDNNFYNCGDLIGNNITTNANGDSCDAYYNIQLDPRFVDPKNGNYNLRNDSPCIGAGTIDNIPSTDIVGNFRGTPPDIGAYENLLDSPLHPPTIITTSLSNAIEDIAYSDTLLVEDLDEGDTHTFEITKGPGWLLIDYNTGILSGIPSNDDVKSGISIIIKVVDSGSLTSEFKTKIDVINVNDPPVIITETLPDATQGQEYSFILDVADPDIDDSFICSILEAPAWLEIADSGILSGMPGIDDIGSDITISIRI